MRHRTITVTFADGASMVGAEVMLDDVVTGSRGGGSFRYTPEYLSHPRAFAFDPLHLRLASETITTTGAPAVPNVIA